jgi:K+-transporting ATPase KdpF subunit
MPKIPRLVGVAALLDGWRGSCSFLPNKKTRAGNGCTFPLSLSSITKGTTHESHDLAACPVLARPRCDGPNVRLPGGLREGVGRSLMIWITIAVALFLFIYLLLALLRPEWF